MIINGHGLLHAAPIRDMLTSKHRAHGLSHGLTECGYDLTLGEDVTLWPWTRFRLTFAAEAFQMPDYLMGRVLNKSTIARMGIDASMCTNIEPGWHGCLTLELRYSGWKYLRLRRGTGICQVIFERIAEPARYSGKYQDQPARAVGARFE